MKKETFLVLITICFFFTPRMGYTIKEGAAYVPGELLVKYRPSIRAAASRNYQDRWGISTIRTLKKIGVHHVKLPMDMTVPKALEIYLNDPAVEYAEPNYYRHTTATPNDTHLSQLWALHNTGQSVNSMSGTPDADIDAPEAWDITTGSSSVVVAVIDSGVDYNHPDLAANIWTNTGEISENGIDDDGNGYIDDVRGWDFGDDDNDPVDSDGHGTHVAGIIAAIGNNTIGVAGVIWTAKIMVLRFDFTVATEVEAMEYAETMGAHVINLSFAGSGYSQAEKDAIDASSAVVVCSAGNDTTNIDTTPIYPASFTSTNIIAVAATDQDDNLSSFSNFGTTAVDLAAPGTNIYSTKPARQNVWSDNFDDNDISDWTTGGTNNTWETTSSLTYSGTHSLTDSPAGNYQNNTDSWARAPVLNLTSFHGAKLEFQLRGKSESNYDYLYVQASTDLPNWTDQNILLGATTYPRIDGTFSDNWLDAYVDLGAYDYNSAVYIRFRFTSDLSFTFDGWYIDDVSVTAASSSHDGTEYQYKRGTSMAAPFVSGVAALIKAQKSSLSNTEIKAQIENEVDIKTSLSGIVATGGRLNAANALPPEVDSDGDDIPDSQDGCPNDPNKTEPGQCGCTVADTDTDNDGIPDCNDIFPNDENEWSDTDGDGIGNNADVFPNDGNEWSDTDGDGIGNNADVFPDDGNEWSDTDGDGIGNNADPDDDNDGLTDSEEQGPSGDDPDYDGNSDGTADKKQGNVTSLHTYNNQDYVTLESPAGTTISNCQADDNPSAADAPSGVDFPYGFFEFTIEGVGAEGAATVTLYCPAGATFDTYYKFGPTPGNDTDRWYEFLYDGQTGAEINGNVITLHFIDNMRGDDDLTANGTIFDVGGPALDIGPGGGGGDGGGGGGGCFIATAPYGSTIQPYVKILREFFNRFFLETSFGKFFENLYYKYLPPIADFIANHDSLRQ